MIKTHVLRGGTPPLEITLLATRTPGGMIVQLLGGDKPHVGATVISHPRPSLDGSGQTSCNSIVIPELGHKEDELAKPLAEKLAVALDCTVVLVAGIHVDGAGPGEIAGIVTACAELVEGFIDACKSEAPA